MRIQLNKEAIRKYKIDYEIFPTESGDCKPQMINIYDNCIFFRFDLYIEYSLLNEELNEVEEHTMINKSVNYIGKYDINRISMAEMLVKQYSKTDKEIKDYTRVIVSIATIETEFGIWFSDYEKGTEFFNFISNWRYS
jgi:hypothetical protein